MKVFQNGSQRGGRQPVQFSNSPNITYQHPDPPYQNKPMGSRGGQGGRGGLRQGRHRGTGNMQTTNTNKIKRFHNLHYCFTCGYDVDQTCLVADTEHHISHIMCDKANVYAKYEASMVSKDKSLPDGTGAVMGWIIANSTRKEKFRMKLQQKFARLH